MLFIFMGHCIPVEPQSHMLMENLSVEDAHALQYLTCILLFYHL